MTVEGNGQEAEPSSKGVDGQAPSTPKSRTAKARKGSSLLSIIFRLLTWYSIITVLFRCPSTVDLVTDSSPKICKPYFHLRSIGAPHLEPYYERYAAPYVDVVRPHYDTLNKRVITPVAVLGAKYGAPRVAQAQAYGHAQWAKNMQPQVLKYQGIATEQYNQHLGPHLVKAKAVLGPYYDIAKTNALQTYYEYLLPTYTTVQPYAVQGYSIASDFTVDTAIPYSQWALTTTGTFLERTVFPKLRILYGENVEPQLVRIGERLGRYREGKKLKSIVNDISSSTSASSIPQSSSSISPPSLENTATTSTEVVPEATPLSEEEIRAQAQKIVAEDLKTWQEKFAKAADAGSEYLDEHVTEITDRLVTNQAEKVGPALNIQLEEKVLSSLKDLKTSVISIVESSKETQEKEDALKAAVRKAGVGIKERAQAVRTWRQKYDLEITSLVTKSAEDTFEILDHIRDLGLQEIGMRWAWTDGITHKDWAKYHRLKTKFDEWRLNVEKVVSEHAGVAVARAASEDVESKAMSIAEGAAKELARLREAGRWKISNGDTSDDWSTKVMPVVEKLKEKVSEASEAIIPTSQSTLESVASVASSSAVDGTSSASSVPTSQISEAQSSTSDHVESASSIVGEASSSTIGTQQETIRSVISAASASASSIVDQASSSIIGTPQENAEKIASSSTTEASSPSASVYSVTTTVPEAAPEAPSSYSSASSLKSPASDIVSSVSSSINSVAPEEASTASKKVWGGAIAQSIEAKEIILDDVETSSSEKIQSVSSAVEDKLADVTRAVNEALHRPTSTGNIAEVVTVLAAEQYSSALNAASVALYGTDQEGAEGFSSVVTSQYTDAVSAASSVIFGTSTPLTGSIAAQVTEAYNDAISRAVENYGSARSIVSTQISGTPEPVHQKMYSSVESAYSEAVSAAHSRFEGALSSAHGGDDETPQGATGSIFSEASSKAPDELSDTSSEYLAVQGLIGELIAGKEPEFAQSIYARLNSAYQTGAADANSFASSYASDAYVSATSAIGAIFTPPPAVEAILEAATSRVSDAVEAASIQFYGTPKGAYEQATSSISSVQSVVSEKIYGAEKGYAEVAQSSISEAASSASRAISEAIYGTPTPTGAFESATKVAGEAYATAASYVDDSYSQASKKLSSAIYGPEQGAVESAQKRLGTAVESARARIASFTSAAADAAGSAASKASEGVEGFASHLKKDEL